MNPSREVALVVVAVALVLALLFPIAFPGVPVPQLPTPSRVAVAPPTPMSLPQPYANATPGLGGLPGAVTGSGTLQALPTPLAVTTEFAAAPTDDAYGLPVATAADRFPAGLPTRLPRATRESATTMPGAYPGYGVTGTAAASLATATPAGMAGTVTPTPTAGTPTASATAGTASAGTATATATPTGLANYP